MLIHPDQIRRAESINNFASGFSDDEKGDALMLQSMYEHMDTFKEILDNAKQGEIDYLCESYDGFYRVAKLIEAMAQGLADGIIKVPKDH